MFETKESDWTKYAHLPKMKCVCKCGGTFQSQAKWMPPVSGEESVLVSQEPCPSCGENSTLVSAVRT